jgi:OmpA-OmpF porin, OOP family
MTCKVLLLTIITGFIGAGNANAQTPGSGGTTTTTNTITPLSPDDKWELGIHVGTMLSNGDIKSKPGFGVGGHIRHSLDHVFSLRGNVSAGQFKGDDRPKSARKHSTTYAEVGGQAVITINNLRFNRPVRRVNLNVFLGVGANTFKTKYENIPDFPASSGPAPNGTFKGGINGNFNGGAGIAYRISPRVNISVEETANIGFGKSADYIDGDPNNAFTLTSYRDIVHYMHVGLNFNLGIKKGQSEPLYWINPMSTLQTDIAELKARPVYDPTDTDGDGIIDAIDQEKTSPAGARVDTRGVTLDSDSDGLADFKDKEPYSPPGYKVDAMGVAQIPKEPKLTEADVNKIVDGKLAGFKPAAQQSQGIIDWFLPMIHYDLDRYDIRRVEYENLFQVAQVMKQNPSIRVVVAGHTDKLSGNNYNNVLSYNRAKAAIDFLVATHGVSRDRLLLNWGGEDKGLVPSSGNSLMNRRVEFRVADGSDTEMGRPEGPKAGKGSFKGNKDAGY